MSSSTKPVVAIAGLGSMAQFLVEELLIADYNVALSLTVYPARRLRSGTLMVQETWYNAVYDRLHCSLDPENSR
jgi:hypothetical protein